MALTFLIDNIFVEFDNRIYRQVIGIPMGTNCAPLIADLFLFCQERNFMDKLVKNKKCRAKPGLNTGSGGARKVLLFPGKEK